MNTHNFFLIVQYITVSVLFVEVLIVFSRWKNSMHSYLFFACLASFISNLGYLFEMNAGSEETYLTALKFSYLGRVWIAFAFFLFSAKICRIRIPRALITVFTVVLMGIYATVLALGSVNLFYPEYTFTVDPPFPRFSHTNGTPHDVMMVMNTVFAFLGIGWLVIALIREKSKAMKSRFIMLLLALGIQGVTFILQIFKVFKVSEYYDITMPGALFGTIFMLIGILRFNLLGIAEIARDFVTDRISEAIIAVDKNGRIEFFNEPAAEIFPEFAALKTKKNRRNHSSAANILETITGSINAGDTLKINDRIYTPEVNDLLYEGENYGKIYALVDDTEHYLYMEELQKQRDIADRANEAKSRFLANMSHEIRTPINAVLGMDEMILREASDKTIRSYASDIMSAGKTLLSLINDILDLSKVEEGKIEIIPVQYDLSNLIGDLVNMIRDRAANKGLKLEVNVSKDIPRTLLGDEIRIRQCAMNLLTNAVKYTEKGSVTLTVGYERTAPDRISLCFTVEDTGIGMKEEDMENLFSPYKRIEEKRNRAIEGTGLGMSITRQLLELMGSELKVQSEYGKGSVFSFCIDQTVVKWEELGDYLARQNSSAAQPGEYRELFHAPDAKLLIVDDTEMNITVIQSLLKRTGIQIDSASSGKEAIKLAMAKAYDVIFIDHMMPDMDGIETLRAIRETGESKNSPAVALTANAISGAREMYLDAGFTDYLSKPVDGSKLERLLAGLLPADKIVSPDGNISFDPASASDTGFEGDDTSSEAGTGGSISRDSLPTWLSGINEIDVEAGLKNCGSADGYMSVLTVFHQTAGPKADEIEKLYNDGDFKNYTIKVHALKSSARIIGASSLSRLALFLEEAGKIGDLDYIKNHNEKLLKMYRELHEKLSAPEETEANLPPIDEASLKEAYQTILEIANTMDYGLMEDLLRNLHEYKLPEKDRIKLSRIDSLLTELDWDGIKMTLGDGVKGS